MEPTNPIDRQYAPATLRDKFLLALDGGDAQLPIRLATELATCSNPLPSLTCQLLDLPLGSTYGSAARRVLERSRNGMPITVNRTPVQTIAVTPISSHEALLQVPVA